MSTREKLIDAMASMDIIDCHEHLPPEEVRTAQPQDVFTLFSHYTRHDLFSAGLDRQAYQDARIWGVSRPEYDSLFDPEVPLGTRWQTLKPYWEAIRYGSYARAALLTAKLVYGIDDINDQTYQLLSERIAAENTPGIYRRMLCDRCRIRVALTQCGRTDVGEPLVPLMPGAQLTTVTSAGGLERLAADCGQPSPKHLDDYLSLLRGRLDQWVGEGAVGIKLRSRRHPPADRKAADHLFRRIAHGEHPQPDRLFVLENCLTHDVIDLAAEMGLVIAVHAGIWGDFREIDSKHMLTLAPAHPQADFDLYHLGMPSVRDTIVVGKNLPNVHLNLCWTHIISQVQTCSGMDELLDQVPVNKVLAFGGDYSRPVEKVVGHLHMARENFARVFGARIDRGMMGLDEALEILKLWFWDNPLALYTRLEV